MDSVLFCPPTYFDVVDVKNPFMHAAEPVDHKAACLEWERVRRAFHDAGLKLHTIDPVAGLEDMVFANNQVFVGASGAGEKFIVPSRMRFVSRQREVPYFTEWFRARGYRVIELGLEAAGEYLEGHGDLLWQREPGAAKPLVWAGYGIRSSRGGVERFAGAMAELGIEVVQLALADERFYHLDTCLAPLAPEAVLIYPGAFTAEALQAIRGRVERVHEVREEEALAFVCNGVAARGRFLTPWMTPGLGRALEAEKLGPVVIQTREFEKSGGSVCCLKLFIPE